MFGKTLNLARMAVGLTLGTALLITGMQPASAALISRDFFERGPNNNDCAGYFGRPFDACTIFVDSDGQRIELSPVVAKYDTTDGVLPATATAINNSLYPSVDGTEFSFSGVSADSVSGTWTYTPGVDDPAVKYWVAKTGGGGGNADFTVFWEVDAAAMQSGGACDGTTDYYTLACLQEALVQTTNTWVTAGGRGLSHITFYNTKGPTIVAAPVTLALMGLGLLGMGMMRRRAR